MTHRRPGVLVVIGGAEERTKEGVILQEFVRRAGGAHASLAVITAASKFPKDVGEAYHSVFTEMRVKQIDVLDVGERGHAASAEVLGAVERATGVFFTGGDQLRLVNLLGGTPLDDLLHERHAHGVVIGGTSAGASAMSTVMIIEGRSEAHPEERFVQKGPGLGFVGGVFIDQHFAERGRLGRLLAATAEHPGYLGIGIDENTAIVIEGDCFHVLGAGEATVLDARAMTHSNLRAPDQENDLALFGVQLHSLPAGYGFDLRTRVPVLPEEKRQQRSEG